MSANIIHSFIHDAFFVTDAKDSASGEPMEVDNSESVTASEETTAEQQQTEEIVHDDGVFTVRIGPSSSLTSAAGQYCVRMYCVKTAFF